jgi:hypothetical protein
MGLQQANNRNYLNISIGKIRKKVATGTPGALQRENKNKEVISELVYDSISGIIEYISFKDHPDFGKSWTVNVKDGDEAFGIKVSEGSRYGGDLLKKMPNLKYGKSYTFFPFDFNDQNGNRKTGLSIKDSNDNKIDSYYHEFPKVNGKFTVKYLNGHPAPQDFKNWDKEDWKVYFMQALKFMRQRAFEYIEVQKNEAEKAPIFEEKTTIDKAIEELPSFDDDIPF